MRDIGWSLNTPQFDIIQSYGKAAMWRIMALMNEYTAAIQRDGNLWIGWIEEIPGVNAQGSTRHLLLENLQSALTEALEMNRQDAQKAAGEGFEEVRISA